MDEVLNEILPRHIAIVMDGNGRWAQNRGLMRIEGHRAGVESVRTVIRCCLQKSIPILSLFAFSSENWSRPENEVEFLMQLFIEALEKEVHELHQHGIKLCFTGDRAALSQALQDQMKKAEKLTQKNDRLLLNIVVNYGGRWDITQAFQVLVQQILKNEKTVDQITESCITQSLNTYPLPNPDLFIRTSGEKRISNFFLWQLAYTELYFSDIHWPDFDEEEFNKALADFSLRERRFGKTSQQLTGAAHV